MAENEESRFPLRLTQVQRRLLVELLPDLWEPLLPGQRYQRTCQFTLDQIRQIARTCRDAVRTASGGYQRNSLHLILTAAEQAAEKYDEGRIHRIPVSRRLYQFKITLQDLQPPIWRRIQVKEGSLDRLHEHI